MQNNNCDPINDMERKYTAFICIVLKNERLKYLIKRQKVKYNEVITEDEIYSLTSDECIDHDGLPSEQNNIKDIISDDTLNDVLNCLNQRQQDVLDLKYVWGLSDEEIGKRMGISKQAVGGLKKRALKCLESEYIKKNKK